VSLLDRAFAATYDPVMRGVERHVLAERRRSLLAGLSGHVVEVGAGTGANLAHLGADVDRLTLLEPSQAMAGRLRAKLAAEPRPATEVIEAPAEALPLDDGSADAVVSTLTLCTVDDLALALAEIRRVLVPGGPLLLLEHVAGDGHLGRVQRAIEPVWKVFGRGCHLTRDTLSALQRAGFDTADVHPWRFPGRSPASPAIMGAARQPST
jgi:ubiquinone/menaquinone biosynthesis C-methylase UbiE